MTTNHNNRKKQKSPFVKPYSVNLSVLVKQHIASLPNPEGWRVLAIDSLNDMIALILVKCRIQLRQIFKFKATTYEYGK